MAKSFGELVKDGIDRTEGMDAVKLASAAGVGRNRIYQIIENQGGVPRRWWLISDAVNVSRTSAIQSFTGDQAKQALRYLKSAGELESIDSSVADIINSASKVARVASGKNSLRGVSYSTVTREQCRAARALLGWSQYDLEKASAVPQSTISHFESGAQELISATNNLLWVAFREAGVSIIREGKKSNGGGVGVRFEN